MPKRIFAGPATASASVVPHKVESRARHRAPPPSTPSSSKSVPEKISFSTTIQDINAIEPFRSDRAWIRKQCNKGGTLRMNTERPSPRYSGIDLWEPEDVLDAMIEGQFAAVAAAREARLGLERAVAAMEARLKQTGRLVYVGAGTSGRLAVQDGAELVPTFNWPQERLLLLIAGGRDALLRSVEGAEDGVDQAIRLVQQHEIGANDVLIAVAASGTTPFTLSCLREARRRGALTIGIANNRGTPILEQADYPIWLDTGAAPP